MGKGSSLGFKNYLVAVDPNGSWFGGICMACFEMMILDRVCPVGSGLSSSDHNRVQLDIHSDVSEENRKWTVKCHRDAPSS